MAKYISAVSFILLLIVVSLKTRRLQAETSLVYGYECKSNVCTRVELDKSNWNKAISFRVCRLFCSNSIGTVWPKPSGQVKIDSQTVQIDQRKITFQQYPIATHSAYWNINTNRFLDSLRNQIPANEQIEIDGHGLHITVVLDQFTNDTSTVNDLPPRLTLEADEKYRLTVNTTQDLDVQATIEAVNFFGARHALETLAQLIVYDDIRRELQIASKVIIEDKPAFHWRGILLDTSRNFYSIKAIKRTLDAMAMVKLNTFHWHITDSHSFPLEIKSQPSLYKLGAYSQKHVYHHEDVREIVEYGRARGIRVMPEFDAPAHVGEGWQKHKDMTVCFNAQPWVQYCVEPPCGQLNPAAPGLYDILEDIYREIFELFEPDVFHMGGDEVSTSCWNSSALIRKWMRERHWSTTNEHNFLRLWDNFQTEALKRVDEIANKDASHKTPIILWSSSLTDLPYLEQYLDKTRYIIQVWTKGQDTKLLDILKSGYKMIISNYDALYFDCGAGSWVSEGQNWCSPYIGWQKVYNNYLENISQSYIKQVLGAEAAVWSEQIDEHSLDQRLWPRASALAERLWSNPRENWREAEPRLLLHRERLIENGISAEAVQPQWCLQHQGECPLKLSPYQMT